MIKFSGFQDSKYEITLRQIKTMCDFGETEVKARWERYDKSKGMQ